VTGLDYERRQLYSYRVVVTDAGLPRRSSTGDLDIEVVDVDDELPVFAVAEYHFRVAENLPIGAVVGGVDAVDGDLNPEFRRVVYSTGNGVEEAASEMLAVDRRTGEIRTTAVLDRETTPSLTFRVFAADPDKPEVTSLSRCDVIVGVDDENDNGPTFVFPNDVNHTVSVNPEVVVAGTRLVRLEALDPDEGLNALVKFFVEKDDSHLGLEVESSSGLSNICF